MAPGEAFAEYLEIYLVHSGKLWVDSLLRSYVSFLTVETKENSTFLTDSR